MRYILLLILTACGGPGWVSEEPNPPVVHEPEAPRVSPPVTPHEAKPDVDERIRLLDWDMAAPTRLCFKWDAQDNADGFRLYVSAESGVFGENKLAGVSAGNVFRACAANLEQGKQYYAIVIAYNDLGDSEPSDELPFIAPYMIDRKDLKLVTAYNAEGQLTFGFAGPANVMQANVGHVEMSTDLSTWVRTDIPWLFENGMHSFVVPVTEYPRAFFRLAFSRGVVDKPVLPEGGI